LTFKQLAAIQESKRCDSTPPSIQLHSASNFNKTVLASALDFGHATASHPRRRFHHNCLAKRGDSAYTRAGWNILEAKNKNWDISTALRLERGELCPRKIA
jgi:hypothetical protein